MSEYQIDFCDRYSVLNFFKKQKQHVSLIFKSDFIIHPPDCVKHIKVWEFF